MKLLILGLLVVTLCGCSTITYQSPSGEKLTRTTFLNTTRAGRVVVVKPDGTRVELENYNADNVSGVERITEAAVRAAVESAK